MKISVMKIGIVLLAFVLLIGSGLSAAPVEDTQATDASEEENSQKWRVSFYGMGDPCKATLHSNALFCAAYKGDIAKVKELLASGTDVNTTNSHGYTALIFAVKAEQTKMVKLLIKAGADANIINDSVEDTTALTIAIKKNNLKIMKLLLEAGANANVADEGGQTPLELAVEANNLKMVKMLIEANVNLEKNFDSVLIRATKNGNTKMVKLLLKDKDGFLLDEALVEPILYAFAHNHHKIAKALIESCWDRSLKDKCSGRQAGTDRNCLQGLIQGVVGRIIFASVKNEGTDQECMEKDLSRNPRLLIRASNAGHAEMVKLLLETVADEASKSISINPWGEKSCKSAFAEMLEAGEIALWNASSGGYTEVVKLLLDFGVDANVTNEYNQPPLLGASVQGHTEVVKLLLEHGADVNWENHGWTPIVFATLNDQTEVVRLLISAGAKLDVFGMIGQSLATVAMLESSDETVKILLDAGMNVDFGGPLDLTALVHLSLREEKTERIKWLIALNADVNKNSAWGTPLTLASEHGCVENVKVLLEAGADVNLTGREGKTALMLAQGGEQKAKKSGDLAKELAYEEIVKLLVAAGAK